MLGTWVEHLTELRRRIIYTLVVILLGLVVGLLLADPAFRYLMQQEPVNGMALHALSLWDGIGLYMKFAFVIALLIAVPFIMLQLWQFVRPGLSEREQRWTLTFVPLALLLFIVGLAFSYWVVFPMAFAFTTGVSEHLGLVETYSAIQYFTFLFNVVVPIALLFELPLVIMFLTFIRILNPLRLRKFRRMAYLILIVLGTFVTPPDFISDILVSIPLILLYELSIWTSAWVYRRQRAHDAKWLGEWKE